MASETALRKRVRETAARVDELRAKYAEKQSKQVGRQLLKARVEASEALTALWEACPEEKPETQSVM